MTASRDAVEYVTINVGAPLPTVDDEAAVGYHWANIGDRNAGWVVGAIRWHGNERAGVAYHFAAVWPAVPADPLVSGGAIGENEFGEDG